MPSDLDELRSFYAGNAYTLDETDQRFLEAFMLEIGPYIGIREGGSLICAGGVHLVSKRYRVAAIGNRRDSAAICRELRGRVDSIGLNVMASNSAAIRCYESLGFERCASYVEGIIGPHSAHQL